MTVAIVASLVAAVVGPLFAYLVAARRLSGKIATSEAADLWQEAASLRREYREEVDRLKSRISAIEAINVELHQTILELQRENDALRRHQIDR